MMMKPLLNGASAAAFLLLANFAAAQMTFSLDKASYGAGEDVVAVWANGPGNAADWIGVYPRGVTPSSGSSAWLYVSGTTSASVGAEEGSVTFVPSSLPGAGSWTAWYLLNDGYTPATEGVDFDIVPAGQVSFSLDKTNYESEENVVASWTGAPGNATDWVGIYPRGVIPSQGSSAWLYVNGTQSATVGVEDGSVTFTPGDLPGLGDWTAWYLLNDGYTPAAEGVDFSIQNVIASIVSFNSSSQFIGDDPITLSWSLDDAGGNIPIQSLTLEDGINPPIDVKGLTDIDVNPAGNAEYTLNLNGGVDTRLVKVFRDTGNSATFSLDKTSYSTGENVVVSWEDAAGGTNDWIAIYKLGETPGSVSSTRWNYLNGSQVGGGSFPSGSMSFAPFPDGDYFALLLLDDGYTVAQGPIRFTVGTGSEGPAFVVDSIRRIHGIAGEPYAGKLGAYARSAIGTSLTFSKLEGPEWLTVSPDGTLSGAPATGDIGLNVFTIKVSDFSPETAAATLAIEVFAPGAIHLPRLKVLAFNIWVGTDNVSDGYNKGLDSILISDADIVAVCENRGRAGEWANDLGWHAYELGGDNAVLSRYPITATFTAGATAGSTVRISDSPLREVHFWSCHLSAYPYGPYDIRDTNGSDAARITAGLAAESNSGRLSQVRNVLSRAASQLAAADTVPVFLLGDFNCPSHLDWTPATAAAGQHFGLVVDWPVTRATENAGMIDAYRVIHPDPVIQPGDTWTPIDPADVQDRIDMVHFKGAPLSVVDCRVFTTIAQDRWPSDHAGTLAEFSLAPVDVDADGLHDAWEVANFGAITTQDSSGNGDLDLLNNFAEQGFGTNPNNPGDPDPLRTFLEDGELHIIYRRIAGGSEDSGVYTVDGIRYLIELSSDLRNWVLADDRSILPGTPLAVGNRIEEVSYKVTPQAGSDRVFVRIRLESDTP
ncbi:MAG: endonuclease/exonuclease/phosphatase family protein [Verrucomicrobiota bacterium]|nr:endonuclease/exonuclease/phosphatase family protein [Verrucomicrobiota bacterium]